MSEVNNIELFERTPVSKAVMKLAFPTILSCLVMVIYNMVDTYFVGMLNVPIQSAAVALAAPVMLAFNAVTNLFGVGTSSMMSRCLGRKDYETVQRSSAFGFYSALFCGVLFAVGCTLFREPLLIVLGTDSENLLATGEYLKWTVTCGAVPSIMNVIFDYFVRAEGNAAQASIGTMCGCLLNIILDPIFILPWGLNMGAAGAGLATFLSNCAACTYFFVLLYCKRGKTFICIHPAKFRADKKIVKEICTVGVPAAIQNLLNVTGMTVLNNFVTAYGSSAVAAMGIAQKLNTIPLYVAMGFSQGIMPLISYNYAGGNMRRMKQIILFTAKLSMAFMVVMVFAYYMGADYLISVFMKNEGIIRYGGGFLRGLCLALPFLCMDFLAVGIFEACGMGKTAFVFAILRKIVLEIPALYLLNEIWPMYGLVYAQLIAEIILSAAAVSAVRKIIKGNSIICQ
ncbi:MAG: MATE family efflux transporter [Eubacteriales bacterium]|nr:MATE family efflux transporter [Eubacteriales bacterium]